MSVPFLLGYFVDGADAVRNVCPLAVDHGAADGTAGEGGRRVPVGVGHGEGELRVGAAHRLAERARDAAGDHLAVLASPVSAGPEKITFRLARDNF